MKIGELSQHSGLAPSKIRFYEAQGLISKVERRTNGYREYRPETLQILEIITIAQKGGFSLGEIRHLLPQDGLGVWDTPAFLATLRQKVVEIDQLQRRLRENKAKLLCIIRRTEEVPPELSCADNAEQVLEALRQ
ncbi:MAG TPA: MerR family transcriptional regulator [Phenylobacterium sp.]|uniref:MerR family transcriptional regulator n=1 Tax=Phenylobacterium sp. TaxID=1871053 RepID=UPI002C03DB7C|nr:MerR family transcriptional regulator [Phenylobacterium sp.]HXA39367.1 MerR family transcriptional regulator [Phenylobacterium sp.]